MATDENEMRLDELFHKIHQSTEEGLEKLKAMADHEAILKRKTDLKGISLLEVKNSMMLQYMLDLCLVMRTKLSGQSIKDHPAVWRLIENRTFMEKMCNIEEKLSYQIKKLVKVHKFGDTGESDGLNLKPSLKNFDLQSDEDEDSEEEDEKDEGGEGKKKEKGVYKPPKLAPVPYTADETAEEKMRKQKERMMKRARSSDIMEDLRRELLDEPEEFVEKSSLLQRKEDRKRKEREEYEEKYFVRMIETKQDKSKSRRMSSMSGLDGLLNFGDMSYLNDEGMEEPAAKKRKTPKGSKGKGKGKKSKVKKKRYH